MFLVSHIQSKIRAVADHLDVEQLASGHLDANTVTRLEVAIKRLRDYDKRLLHRRTSWLKLLGWIWSVAAPVILTYFSTLVIPTPELAVAEVLVYVATYLLLFVLMVWIPLFYFGAIGGFRWKRLILLGQTGDVGIDLVTKAMLRWALAPQANTYQSENRLFASLGLPKPNEFPWDLVLSPKTVLGGALALASLILALALSISVTRLGWPILIPVILVFVSLFCLRFIIRPISRAMRERVLHGAC